MRPRSERGGQDERRETGDGIERIFRVNVLALHVLTALVPRPERIVYRSAGSGVSGRRPPPHRHLPDHC